MPTASWNEVPAELQQRVLDEGLGAVGDLAAWAYENRPGWLRNDDLHDLLCALIRFLVRADGHPERSIQSIPAILTAIAYRQRCQRFRDKAAVWTAQLRALLRRRGHAGGPPHATRASGLRLGSARDSHSQGERSVASKARLG